VGAGTGAGIGAAAGSGKGAAISGAAALAVSMKMKTTASDIDVLPGISDHLTHVSAEALKNRGEVIRRRGFEPLIFCSGGKIQAPPRWDQ
jgi:hypothetical protein